MTQNTSKVELANQAVADQQRHEGFFLEHCQRDLNAIAEMISAMSAEWVTYWST